MSSQVINIDTSSSLECNVSKNTAILWRSQKFVREQVCVGLG